VATCAVGQQLCGLATSPLHLRVQKAKQVMQHGEVV
jgi:hypothetical protein